MRVSGTPPLLPTNAHVLQTWQWGQVKNRYGWQPAQRLWRDHLGRVVAAALILSRSITLPVLRCRFQVLYVPKGPVLDWQDAALRRRVLYELAEMARQQRAIFIKIDPDVSLGQGLPGSLAW
jgi:lipid II:glycine glycyltransferase (peptidoglycan interpeptide bridge formation enzyme)